jgi:hypothetical protein
MKEVDEVTGKEMNNMVEVEETEEVTDKERKDMEEIKKMEEVKEKNEEETSPAVVVTYTCTLFNLR